MNYNLWMTYNYFIRLCWIVLDNILNLIWVVLVLPFYIHGIVYFESSIVDSLHSGRVVRGLSAFKWIIMYSVY